MRIVPTKINTNSSQLLKNSDFLYNDESASLGPQIEAKKPLPKVPAEMLHISPISGGATTTTTTWTEESYDPLTFVHPPEHQTYYQPYYYPQQNSQEYYHSHPYYNHQQQQNLFLSTPPTINTNAKKHIAGGSEWKMAATDLQRSESLKIEASAPTSRFSNTLETHLEKPFEPPVEEKRQQLLHKKMSKLELVESGEEETSSDGSCEEEDLTPPISVAKNSPPTTKGVSSREVSISEVFADPLYDQPSQHRLSIASCSLINDKSNIKLYRRMAIKTRSTETQLAYAKYLIQISKLYNPTTLKSHQQQSPESPSQIRHRLLTEAGYWIERLAKSGVPEALFIQGRWYLLGPQANDCVLYPKTQETKALHCFVRASRGGWADAHYELANLWKKKGNLKRAVYYYDIGAKDNHTPSIYKMAKILLCGQLKVNKDMNKGLDYLLRAANMKDHASAEPAFVAACLYAKEFRRIGVDRHMDNKSIEAIIAVEGETNESVALKYLKKSAHFGNVDAIYFMGQAFEKGMLGQTVDFWQAYQYYMKAAEMNHPEAMFALSQTYFRGIPGLLVPQKDFAFRWCKRSADIGLDEAEYMLGKYYEEGVGVMPNFPLALEYYGKAASKGFLPAAEKLNRPINDDVLSEKTPIPTPPDDDENEQVYFLKNSNSQSKINNQSEHSNQCFIQ